MTVTVYVWRRIQEWRLTHCEVVSFAVVCISERKVQVPWHIRNNDLHRDLQVDVVTGDIQRFAQKLEGRLHHHEKVEAIQRLDIMGILRRRQRWGGEFGLV